MGKSIRELLKDYGEYIATDIKRSSDLLNRQKRITKHRHKINAKKYGRI